MTARQRLSTWLRLALLALSLLGASTTASALVPTQQMWRANEKGVFTQPTATKPGACDAALALWKAANPTNPYIQAAKTQLDLALNPPNGACLMNVNIGGAQWAFDHQSNISPISACPANSTGVSGGCQCSAGFVENAGQCTPNQCGQNLNKPMRVNWTIGWTRTNNDDDRKWIGGAPSVPPSGGSICMEGCMVGVNLELAGGPYRSQEPAANGMYRTSADFQGVGLGGACTETTTSVDKDQPIPPCPGHVGQGPDGKTGCYGTADKPITPTNAPIPPDNKDPIAGNPAAGKVPTEGEGGGQGGAGRTPSTGSGGNAGGPAAAATPAGPGGGAGGSASGTGQVGGGTGSGPGGTAGEGEGEDQAACGAPGQPVCAVKFDEKDMPTGQQMKDGMQTETDKLNAAMDLKGEGISTAISSSSMDTSWGFFPNWTASQSCTPWQLGTLPYINKQITVDICVIQPYVLAIMSFLWVVGTFFAIISMVGRVVGSGVH